MEILNYETISELAAIGDAWDRLGEQEPRFVPSFSELKFALEAPETKFRLFLAVDNAEVVGIACFVYGNAKKNYAVAERKLFTLPIKTVSLFGSCVLGQLDEHTIKTFFTRIINDSGFDLINLGEIIIDSPLYKAVNKLRGGVIVSRSTRTDPIRWMIKLPKSFDDYTKSLGPKTRKNAVREFKKLERESVFEVRVIHRLDQIDIFLQDAEKISRLTYQWNVGTRFCNDEVTRKRLVHFAQKGKLRCYIAYIDGQPCTFRYGEWSHRIYVGRIVGYDPKYANKSPGTALLLYTIRDLIDNTDCEFFDFGEGGYFEYKTRFGNISVKCARLQVGLLYRPYSFLLLALDQIINSAKTLLSSAVGQGKFLQCLKKATRRYGDS